MSPSFEYLEPEDAPWYDLFNGDRINDHPLSLGEKRKARQRQGVQV